MKGRLNNYLKLSHHLKFQSITNFLNENFKNTINFSLNLHKFILNFTLMHMHSEIGNVSRMSKYERPKVNCLIFYKIMQIFTSKYVTANRKFTLNISWKSSHWLIKFSFLNAFMFIFGKLLAVERKCEQIRHVIGNNYMNKSSGLKPIFGNQICQARAFKQPIAKRPSSISLSSFGFSLIGVLVFVVSLGIG